jgi:hypothetical protein
MKNLLVLPLVALTVGCMAEPPPAQTSARSEMKLAEATEGSTAGAPQSCVSTRDLLGNRSAGEGAFIFSTRNSNLIYVNRPPAGCPELRGDALKTRTTGTQLCRGDLVEVFDPLTGFSRGGCGLGDFVPYRRLR